MLVASFSACGGGNPTTQAPGGEGTAATPADPADPTPEGGGLSCQGEITIYALAYRPAGPTEARPNPPTELRKAAEECQALHPDITIWYVHQKNAYSTQCDHSIKLLSKTAVRRKAVLLVAILGSRNVGKRFPSNCTQQEPPRKKSAWPPLTCSAPGALKRPPSPR